MKEDTGPSGIHGDVPREPNPMPAAKRLRVGDDMAAPIVVDDPDLRVSRAPSKAKAGRDLPSIRALNFQLLPDGYTLGLCFFFCSCPQPPCSPHPDPLTWCGLAGSGNHNVPGMVWYRGGRECCECLQGLGAGCTGQPHLGGFATPFLKSCNPHRWKGFVVAYKHTKHYWSKIWHQHCCDICCSLESGYGGSQNAPYDPRDGGSL